MVNPYRQTLKILAHCAQEFRRNPNKINADTLDQVITKTKLLLQRTDDPQLQLNLNDEPGPPEPKFDVETPLVTRTDQTDRSE